MSRPRTSRGPKVRGVRELKSSKISPLKHEKSLFIAFLYYSFKKSRGSADPADPVLGDHGFDIKIRILRDFNAFYKNLFFYLK